MNYVVVVLAFVWIMWACTWFIDGRKHFAGPSDMEERLEVAARLLNEEEF